MGRFSLPRRAFLQGLGGVGIALPFLEVMGDTGGGNDVCRYLICYGGLALGNLDESVPTTAGAGYALPRTLVPLGEYPGLVEEVSVVSGLLIPWGSADTAPAGGRVADFHGSTDSPLLSGVRSTQAGYALHGPSSDILVAEAIGQDTRFESLGYRVQPDRYRGGGGDTGIISYGLDAAGDPERRPPIASPKVAFESLFVGFVPPDPAEAAELAFKLEQEKSILDVVLQRSEALRQRLGAEDKARLDRHFTEIRELEQRISETAPDATGDCEMLPDPGDDPMVEVVEGEDTRDIGWSDESARGRLFADLIHMAFTCDLTRSAAWQLTYSQTFMSAVPMTGRNTDVHELGHNGSSDLPNLADAFAWHVDHFAYLADKMLNTPDGDGTLLDHSAMVFVTEAGRGYDPVDDNDGASHSSENMLALVAGRAGGLQPGKHIVATGEHPAKTLISAMNAVGVQGGLGEVTGQIPELFEA